MDDDYLDHLRALDQGESDKKTDDNDDKTVDMSFLLILKMMIRSLPWFV
jgi:hypothetical protein